MSADDDIESISTDMMRPVTIDNLPIHWDDNLGSLTAAIYELAEFMIREGFLQPFLEQRIVIAGKVTIVDKYDAIFFVTGETKDPEPHDAHNPAPPNVDTNSCGNAAEGMNQMPRPG